MDTSATGAETLRYVAVLPSILILAFIYLFLKHRK